MSRSVRDIRSIVTASRQSMHDDDDLDGFLSDESDGSESDNDTDTKDLRTYIGQRPSSALGQSNFKSVTGRPASARSFTNKVFSNDIYDVNNNTFSDRPHTVHNELSYRHVTTNHEETLSKLKAFPSKFVPVPPIGKRPHTTKTTNRHPAITRTNLLDNQISTCYSPDLRQMILDDEMQNLDLDDDLEDRNFDVLFQFLDGTIIATWLESCNRILQDLNYFMELHLVDFIQFFLTDLSFVKYVELLDLEFSILLDHFKCAFRSGFTLGHLDDEDIEHLAKSVVKEYFGKLKKLKSGPSYMLDIITTFCHHKKETYHDLLKDVVCHSSDKKNIQWLLAIRAFSLLNFVSGILKFYENFTGKIVFPKVQVRYKLEKKHYDVNEFVIQAVSRDFLQVLDYFYTNRRINFETIFDDKKRNLVSIATSGKNYDALIYLLALKISAEGRSENGNTPLQCAVSLNDLKLASILLEHGVNVNAWNEQAEGATALHMAILLGSAEMVHLLLEHGADRRAVMGVPATVTPLMLAKDLEMIEIVELLQQPVDFPD